MENPTVFSDSDVQIAVSVLCAAYNHEKYLRDALDSFLMQKTNFRYEVIVHDDASTDGTAQIIREYAQKYPEIFRPIYQTENQYSKGHSITISYLYPCVRGKYVAICEGDDYWTDPLKLQKQYDALEQHPELDICTHRALQVEANTKAPMMEIFPAEKDTLFSTADVIQVGTKIATASLFYRASLIHELPAFRRNTPIDYTIQIHCALRGGMIYLNDCMSVYRWQSDSSWSKQQKVSIEKREAYHLKLAAMLRQLDEDTEHRYSEIINEKIRLHMFPVLEARKSKEIFSKQYRKQLKKLSWTRRIKLWLVIYCPWAVKWKQAKKSHEKQQ